jgi:single-stranded DNA-binding protein
MQQIQIIGNLGKDAEVKTFSEKPYTVFSVAVKEKETTTWFNVYKYGANDNLRPYLKKGTKVFIQGSFSHKVDDKDGKTFVNLNINCDGLQLISQPAQEAQVVEAVQSAPATVDPLLAPATVKTEEDKLPF